MGTSATSAFSTTGTNLNDQAIANLPSSVTQEYKPAVVEPEQVNEEATDASNTTPTTKDHLSNSILMRLTSKSKTKGQFCCSVLKTLFNASELMGKRVMDQDQSSPLIANGWKKYSSLPLWCMGKQITDKVWAVCVSSMNAHLRKYHKE